ncbi:MAG: (2Fe-2S)-binding protein [Candidatus Omnitrophica bacterium]|nr:(2Fe-2S)-binding protein [Candidatus Omnitrophota bacterium]
MSIVYLCPKCSGVGMLVPSAVVKNLVKIDLLNEGSFYACVKKECDVSYFNNKQVYTLDDVKLKLFYKDDGEKVPICYCSNLTRGEIEDAVSKGHKTIADVQKYTNKDRTGQCAKENPLGMCCREVFLNCIEKAN